MIVKEILPPFQIIGHFGFSRYIAFAIYLDIVYIWLHSKSYVLSCNQVRESQSLTWLLSAGFVVSDSKEPRKRRNNARVKHSKSMLSKVGVTGKRTLTFRFLLFAS